MSDLNSQSECEILSKYIFLYVGHGKSLCFVKVLTYMYQQVTANNSTSVSINF